MAAIVGALRAVLSLESAAFTRGLTAAQKSLADFDKRMRGIGGQITKVGAIISVASTGLALAVKRQLNAADDMSKAAQKFGVPIEALSQLKYAAELSDVSFESLGTSLGFLSKKMVNSPDVFDKLGIAVRDATGNIRPVQNVLMDVADVIAKMPDGAEKTALSMQLLGKSVGVDMIPMLNEGGTAIKNLMAEADKLGVTINSKTGKAAEDFNDNLTRLKTSLEGLAIVVVSNLAPALAEISDKIVALAGWFSALDPKMQKILSYFAGFLIVLGPVALALGAVVGGLGFVASAFAAIAASGVMLPVIATLTFIVGAASLIYANWGGVAAYFEDLWARVRAATQNAWVDLQFWWDDVVAYFEGLLAGLPGAFTDAWEKVKAVTAQWVTDFKNIGSDIVNGLKAGIEERWTALTTWFSDKTQAMSGQIKSILGIQSPSKVFREIGQWITEGLGLGIKDNVPMVEGAMGDLTQAITGPGNSLVSAMKGFDAAAKSAFTSFVTGASSGRNAIGQLLGTMANNFAGSAFDILSAGLGFGGVKAFATGGVVGGPTAFPMANGMGLMGEAGPEAIMPLTRIGGKLGVATTGGGGGIHIDARGAVEGTDVLIMKRLQQFAPGIVQQAVSASAQARARGR